MKDTTDHLKRTDETIGADVQRFFKNRLLVCQPEFTMRDLWRFLVTLHGYIAPDSPSRVMRDLRQRGLLDYRLLSRQGSRYWIIRVAA